ncbi:ATP-dependent 3'-5' DNA helicase [Coemansia sp. RSA 1843]|nr:ATP-dependent 3'-5' DNA helicase [Coemansia sp. RSA 1843]
MPELVDLFKPFAALSLFILRSSGGGSGSDGSAHPIAFAAISDAMRSSLGLALAREDLEAFVDVLDDSSMLSLSWGYDGGLCYTVGPAFTKMDLGQLVASFAKRQAARRSKEMALPLGDLVPRILDTLQMTSTYETTVPSAPAVYADPTSTIDGRLWTALRQACGIEHLYSHQAQAIDCVLSSRRNVVVSTATASGKSVIYQVPVLQSLLDDPQATALLVFPTKALAQDQLSALRNLAEHIPGLHNVVIDTLDGDQDNSDRRRAIRDTASVILTNPDTLHAAMLPNTSGWRWFWLRLRLVVIDEMHVYQAQFGQHVSHILRRLQRQLGWIQGTRDNARFIACSATTSNPAEHMQALTGLTDIDVVDSDGSPRGTKHMALWDNHSKCRSAILSSCSIAVQLLSYGLRTIVFCKYRQTCELVFREISDVLDQSPRLRMLQSQIMSYRAGYTAGERRAIERSIFSGDTRLVVATSALELGIDIGSLDAVVMVGVPLSAASLWQQAGRAGRRTNDSLAIVVATSTAIDRRTVDTPEGLFDRNFAPASISTEPSINAAHLQCAAFEIPFSLDELCDTDGLCWDSVTQKWICALSYKPWPPEKVPIRSIQQTDWEVVETRNSKAPVLLEELDGYHALFALYEGGILLHRGHSFSIDKVDAELHMALVSKVDVSWYTEQRDYIDVVPLMAMKSRPLSNDPLFKLDYLYGELNVTATVFGYKRIDTKSRKVLEYVKHISPPLTIKTRGVWVDIPLAIAHTLASRNHNVEASIHAAQHALIAEMSSLVDGCMSQALCTECKSPLAKRSKIPRLIIYEKNPVANGPTASTRISMCCLLASVAMFSVCSGLYTPGRQTLGDYVRSLSKREDNPDGFVTAYLDTLHDGLLIKENEQTFCGVIPITEKYAFAAASCFEFVDGKLNDNMDYKVYLSGTGYEKPTLLEVTSIQARDDYNPNSFANNLAVVTIDNSKGTGFTTNIGGPASEWATVNYIQHSMLEDLSGWNKPDIYSGKSIDNDACKSASSLFKANTDTLSCNSQTRNSFINEGCKTPLKFAVGSSGGKVAVVGLYSYSAISGTPGDGFCGSDNTIVSYYTNLYDYIPWATEITDKEILGSDNGKEVSDPESSSSRKHKSSANQCNGGDGDILTNEDGSVISYLNGLRPGILANKDGQTACGVIPINKNYAFVAASCFQYSDDGKPDESLTYQVYLSAIDQSPPKPFDVADITVRTDYDPNTFANNLAIISFDYSNDGELMNDIGSLASEWDQLTYIQQNMTSDLGYWNAPFIYPASAAKDSACSKASSLYKANPNSLVCDEQTRTSVSGGNCQLPLQFVVGTSANILAVVGLYSYSAISGSSEDGFCDSGSTIINYYTNLFNYIPWAAEVTSGNVDVRHPNIENRTGPTEVLAMQTPPDDAENDGSLIFSLFGKDKPIPGKDGSKAVKGTPPKGTPPKGPTKCTGDQATLTIDVPSHPTNCKVQQIVLNF